MEVEKLIYLYMAVSLSMILFNLASVLALKIRKRLDDWAEKVCRRILPGKIRDLRNGKRLSRLHRRRMYGFFLRSGNLIMFLKWVREHVHEDAEGTVLYLNEIYPVFDSLSRSYFRKNDRIRTAFYLYVLKEIFRFSGRADAVLIGKVTDVLKLRNTYCRENALQVVYSLGREDLLIEALFILDESPYPHHGKLLVDGMLGFSGEKQDLAGRLWKEFERFSPVMQGVILDYMRFGGFPCRDRVFGILTDEDRKLDLRLAAIRYFARYPDDRAYPVLAGLAGGKGEDRWEFAAVASSALASYPGEQTEKILKNNLHSSNWHVRYNAAESLGKLGVEYYRLIDVTDGDDRYAREMLQFQFDMQYNRRAGDPEKEAL